MACDPEEGAAEPLPPHPIENPSVAIRASNNIGILLRLRFGNTSRKRNAAAITSPDAPMRLSLAGPSGIEAALAKVNALMVRLAEPLPVRLAGFGVTVQPIWAEEGWQLSATVILAEAGPPSVTGTEAD